jgi:hypothetical protein
MPSKTDFVHAIAEKAAEVRKAQKRYFADRTRENLAASKKVERELDVLLDEHGKAEGGLDL